MKHIHFVLLFFQILSFPFISKALDWEYCDTDSVNIKSMYSFGNGHLIAGSCLDSKVMFQSRNYGKTWDTLSLDLPENTVNSIKYYNNKLFACIINNYPCIRMSDDSGKTWYEPPDDINYEAYCMGTKDSIALLGNYRFLSRSTDYGETWTRISIENDTIDNIGAVYDITRYQDTFYIGTALGVFASKDFGLTWEERGNNTVGATYAIVSSITMLDTILIAGTFNGVYSSNNFGGNAADSNWNWMFYNELWQTEAYIISDSLIYVTNRYGGGCGLFMSSDTGETWEQFYIDTSVPYIDVDGYFEDDKYIYAFCNPGIWRLPKDTNNVAIKQKPEQTFSQYKITMRNRLVEINSLQKGEIKLELYSINGRCVQRIYKGIIKKGSNIFTIALHNKIARGVYIINAEITNNRISHKINITY